MLRKLNIILQFYRSLSFFDTLDTATLLILASRTFITVLKSNTLVHRQGYKSSQISFIKRGRAKVLKNVEFVDISGIPIGIENYKRLYREPSEQERAEGKVKSI